MTTASATAAHIAGNAGKRIARSCVLAVLIAAILLTALPSVFHAPPVNAQETSEVVWDTNLTVWAPRPPANTWPRVVGWTSNFAGRDWLGTVSSSTFTFEDNDYEVVQLLVDRDTSTLSLVFKAAKDGEKEDRDLLRLRFIEGTAEHTYDLADATTTSIEHPRLGAFTRLAWSGVTDTALGWAHRDSITVKMESIDAGADAVASTPNSPATGRPAITGPAQVGEILTADTSGIADADGLDSATFSYQWIRNEDVLIVDIADATGSTYTPSEYDMGRLSLPYLMVRVSFTDDAGNDESLTSAPFGTLSPAPQGDCPEGGYDPAPVDVSVEAASVLVNSTAIVVDSTTDEYFVLYVRPDLDSEREVVASVTVGQDGTTVLAEPLPPLPRERYRVEKYLVADPADVDGDCIDDITELEDPVGMNPVNPAPAVPFDDGVVAIPDRETFETIIAGTRVNDPNLQDLPFLIFGHQTDRPAVYFSNTETHYGFIYRNQLIANWRYWEGRLFGDIVYHPDVLAPNGELGVYVYSFGASHVPDFATVALAHEVLAASMPLLDKNLVYRPISPRQRENYDRERTRYDGSRVDVLLEEDILRDVDFIPFNQEEGYGFLRVMSLEERPNPRDIVIYESLPNELSRVAGIITTVAQTPLAHVNLRAVQDGVPNAYIRNAVGDVDIAGLIGSFVHYAVTEDGYSLRAATRAEVDAHYADSRPTQTQTPERDLTVTGITDLDDIGFDDWDAFGVKAANLAVLRTLGFPEETVPDGFAVPFYFYDEFMKHNEFYEDIEEMLADQDFQSDFDVQEEDLKELRKKIKQGESPQWMIDALVAMHATFPEGQSLRYRSSTNNEDLPGFSGAGLYDSKTQKPDETAADGIDKSLKQVFASMWNFRAFTEREFHRIDHLAAAMGVLVHPNFSDELANGVAVSFNPIVGGVEGYYVNTQLGEDLVTNPEALSVPEEVLLHEPGKYPRDYEVLATSNRVEQGKLLMSDAQMGQLRRHIEVIHDDFAELYGIEAGEKFAMEIEFKVTSGDVLSIKQARPWVFSHVEDNSQATGLPTIGGTAWVDETLTAETSGIADADGLTNVEFRYQWIRSDAGTDTDIENATASTYELSDDDEGKTIRVSVSFTDDAENEETLTSEATEPVVANPNSAAAGLPSISGTAQVDETLTADTSDIADADGLDNVVVDYQWVRSDGHTDTDIQDATGSTYTLGVEDEGKTVKIRVSFTDDAGYKESLTSTATDSVAPESPVVWSADMSVVDLGNGTIGAVSSDLFSNAGGSADLQAKWLWYYTPGRNLRLAFTDVVPGAEEMTLQIGDVALTFQAGDSAFTWNDVDIDWEDAQIIPARIVPTSAIAVPQPNSPPTGLPAIAGTAQVDETLTADTSGISDVDGLTNVSYRYQWSRNDGNADTDIEDATDSTHELSVDDVGKTIQVRVSFSDDADNEESLTSAATAAVEAKPNSAATGLPTISGTAQVGQELTVDTSSIADEDGLTDVSYSYQWSRNDGNADTDIEDATDSTHELSVDDVGKTIQVRVSFTDDADNEESLTSAATAAVQAKPNSAPTGLPTISGTAQVGQELTVDTSSIADEDGLTDVSYSYQWSRNDGNADTDIEDAAVSTYTLATTDEGKTIQVRVSFTDDADNEESLTSAATAAVEAKPNSAPTGLPTISGTPQVYETLTADTSNIADEDGLADVSYSYQWSRNDGNADTDIEDATGSTHELSVDDVGKTIQVRVSFTDGADNEETLTSAASDTVAATKPGAPGHVNVFPHDTGALDVYWETPTSNGGSAITGYKVQWKETADSWDTAADVSEATVTGTTHTITGMTEGVEYTVRVMAVNDVGEGPPSAEASGTPQEAAIWSATLTVGVAETFAGYTTFLADSTVLGALSSDTVTLDDASYNVRALGLLKGNVILTVTPKLTAGFVLVVGTAELASSDASTKEANSIIQFRWNDPGLDLSEGKEVAVRLTAPDDNTPATGAPTVSGTAQVDQTLTASTSGVTDADGLTNPTFSYQWIRSDGGTDTDIAGETAYTYTVVSEDVGKTIKVRVSFTDDAETKETLTSTSTAAVAATVPGAPQDVQVSLSVSQALDVSWEAPDSDGGSAVTGYKVQWKKAIGSWDTPEDVSEAVVTGITHTIPDLTGGTVYSVRVLASNEVGDGSASAEQAGTPQTPPEAPEAVQVYGYGTGKLEVRWSAAVSASITGFKVQWRSGTDEWDTSRSDAVNLASAHVRWSSTETSRRYRHVLDGLTNDTVYDVRVVASNASGDGDPAAVVSGTPKFTISHAEAAGFIENEIISVHEADYPWLRIAFDRVNREIILFGTDDRGDGIYGTRRYQDNGLDYGQAYGIRIRRITDDTLVPQIIHELGHILSLTNRLVEQPGPVAVAWLYFDKLSRYLQHPSWESCYVGFELMADVMVMDMLGTDVKTDYWPKCSAPTDEAFAATEAEALEVVRSMLAGEMPPWFADTYHDSEGNPDLELLWSDVREISRWSVEDQRADEPRVVYFLRNEFGGYCSHAAAVNGLPELSATRNPWRDGGCVPEAPPALEAVAAVDATMTVSWESPGDDGGSAITGYKVQWKSGVQDFDASREAAVTDLADLSHKLADLTHGVEYTIRVVAQNFNGDGTASEVTKAAVEAKPNSPATGAPTIDGTAQVGETLTADTSPIADEDGLTNVSYRYQWTADGSDIDGATGSTYALTSSEQGQTIQVRVTFADDADNAESLTSVATETVAQAPSPLTVSLENAATSHNGTDVFTFEIRFSEQFGLSYKTLRDDAFTVVGGEVKKAQRMDRDSDTPNTWWLITVEPDGNGDVTITLPATTDCTDDGAICTEDGRRLSNSLIVTVSDPNWPK